MVFDSCSYPQIVLSKALSGSIGISIKSSLSPGNYEFQKEMIVVDTISPQSPASLVDIKRGDILLSVNDVDVESFKQAIRLLKNGGERLVRIIQPAYKLCSGEINFLYIWHLVSKEKLFCSNFTCIVL